MTALADDPRQPWEPFGITEADWSAVPGQDGMRVAVVRFGGEPGAMAGRWLAGAAGVLALLAAAAAAVSWQAQYMMVRAVKHAVVVAAIEAGIPDAGALVFAALGVALALHGKRAVRARALNAACIGISLAMNALAAGPGWRGLAIWVMPAAVYALASDTLIGVIRAHVIARHRQLDEALADDEITPLHLAGAVLLWLLRLALAPPSTLRGFHGWVKSLPAGPPARQGAEDGQPTVPGARPEPVKGPPAPPAIHTGGGPRGGTKQDQFLSLVIARYGPLTEFDLKAVSRAAAELAPEAELHPGTARKILRAQVLAAQNGDPQ